jgi:hypothetical protein
MNLIIVFVLLLHYGLMSQSKGDYIWVAGYQKNYTGLGGHDTHLMKFESGNLYIQYFNSPMGLARYNSSICDSGGNLLFYTNGRAVMNAKKEIISNVIDINDSEWTRRYWPDPYGGFPGAQDVLMLPDPKLNGGYYMLHKLPVYNPPAKDSIEIRYSYIAHDATNDESEITIKNNKFYPKNNLLLSYLTAIRHSNKRDWWVLQPAIGNNIITFLIDLEDIKHIGNQDAKHDFTREKSSASGTAKFSPDGKKYAIYNEDDNLLLYDFDRSTGLLNFKERIVPIDTSGQGIFCSVEWSPNSRYIYTATQNWLHQIDTQEPDPDKRIVLIDTYNGTLDPFSTRFFLMAQGPDCKIYMSPANGSYSLHVINKPDEPGKACDFVQNGIKLPNANGGSLPNFPRFRVDEADKCDPKISSVFGDAVYYRRQLNVYPNPSSGVFRVTIPEGFISGSIVVTNLYGQVLMQKSVDNVSVFHEIDITSLPGGVYNIEIYPTDNRERIFYGKQVVKVD